MTLEQAAQIAKDLKQARKRIGQHVEFTPPQISDSCEHVVQEIDKVLNLPLRF